VSVMIATTDPAVFDHETLTRFYTLYLDESEEQTQRVLDFQDRMAGPEGMKLNAIHERLVKLHRNVQRMLKPLNVINSIGVGVQFPAHILHSRREKAKLESLIETYALMHQYQRPIKEEAFFGITANYIEVTREDLDAVHRIAADTLRQALDSTSKPCRELLGYIHELVEERFAAAKVEEDRPQRWQVTFTRKELMERSRWSRWHIVQRMGKKGQRYCYSLVEEHIPEMPRMNRIV
jgi:DNA primase